MDQRNLKGAIAFGNAAFTQLERAGALYEQLVERLYGLGEDVTIRIKSPERVADALVKAAFALAHGMYVVARRNNFPLQKQFQRNCNLVLAFQRGVVKNF